MESLITKLVRIPGPSGYEKNVRDFIIEEIKDYVDEYKVDPLGNLIVLKGEKGPKGKNIMVSAHMDEIGLMVTHVEENGFVRFTNIGGVRPTNCAAARVQFLNGVRGVIGYEPTGSNTSVPALKKMFVDVGASSDKDCPVEIGDVACFERIPETIGTRMVSKAMDDRIGVVVLIEALKRLKTTENAVYGVFSVQEEVGLRGATTAAYAVEPEIGIALDVTLAADTPKGDMCNVELGAGAAIKVRDAGMLASPEIIDWMVKTAKKNKIKYQKEVLLGGSTDARVIQTSRAGVPFRLYINPLPLCPFAI